MANTTELTDIFSTVLKEINESGQSDILKGSIGSIKDLQAVLKEQDKLIDKTLRAGDEKSAMRILKAAKQAQQAQVEATDNLREAKEKLLKLDQEGNAKGRDAQLKVVGKINQEINKLAREAKLMQKNATEFSKGAEHSLLQYSKVLENREERIKELGKTGAMIEEKFSNRFEASVTAFTSGVGDLASFGDTFAGGLKSLGGFLSEKAGKASEKASQGKGDMGMANMLGGLSKVISTVAVIGGSIMMLVKLFQFVEGAVLDANKKLLSQASITDLVAVNMGSTAENLKLMRKEFQNADFANEMNMTLDDTLELTGAFNQINLGIKQFGGGVVGIKNMKAAMKEAKGQSYALGISMDEASQYMAKFSFDLGVAASDSNFLSSMADEFANIRDMALQSGYSTSNFFKKVEELAGSLENMNYRSKEAGILFLRFSKVLGKSGLDKALQSLFSGFRGEDYLEQLKRNMISKSSELRRATEIEAVRFAKNFDEKFGGEKAIAAMKEAGLDLTDGQGGKLNEQQVVAKIGALNEQQRQEIMGVLVDDKRVSGEMRDQLYSFMRLARGANKKSTKTEKIAAQEEFSAGGNMRTNFARMSAFLGDKDINKMGIQGKASLLSLPGVTKELVDQFAQLQTSFKGQYRRLKGIASGKIEVPRSATTKDAKTGEERPMTKKEYIDSLNAGVTLNDEGKLIMTDTKMAVGSFTDFLQAKQASPDDPGTEANREKTTNEFLAEGREATQSVFDVLNNNIQGILREISGGIMDMVTWLTGGKESDKTKQAKTELLDQMGEEMKKLQSVITKENKSKGAKKRELAVLNARTDLTKKEKARQTQITTEIQQHEAKIKDTNRQKQLMKSRQRYVQKNTFSNTTAKGIEDEVTRRQTKEGIQSGSGGVELPDAVREQIKKEKRFFETKIGAKSVADITGVTDFEGLKRWLNNTPIETITASGVPGVMSKFKMTAIKVDSKDKRRTASLKSAVTHRVIGSGQTENRQYVTPGEARGGAKGKIGIATENSSPVQAGLGGTDAVFLEMEGKNLGRVGGDTAVRSHKNNRITSQQNQTVAETRHNEAIDATNTTLNAIKKAVEATPAEKDTEAKRTATVTKDIHEETTKEGVLKALKSHEEKQREEKLKQVAEALGLNQKGGIDKLAKRIAGYNPKAGYSDAQKKKLKTASLTGNRVADALIPKQEDFWIDGRGNLWSIDPQDFPSPLGGGAMAMTKPGGAVQGYVDQAISKYGGGGGGGNFNITVNVDGSKNPVDTGRQVVNELKKAQDKIMGGTR
jgi:hypothetical protein